MSTLNDPIVLGVVAIIPATLATVLVYKRARKGDEAAERVGVASESAQSITQAFEGLGGVIDGLNDIIVTLRSEARVDEATELRLQKALDDCGRARNILERELNRMHRLYGTDEA